MNERLKALIAEIVEEFDEETFVDEIAGDDEYRRQEAYEAYDLLFTAANR